jgi:hypothetical protein
MKGERMGSFPSSFELPADLALADGLMLVFQHPAKRGWTAHGINGSHLIFTGDDI